MEIITLLIEAIFVGIITVILGYVAGYIVNQLEKKETPDLCKNWNENYVMEKSLFLTGFLVHVFCELTTVNKWYCKHGLACRSN